MSHSISLYRKKKEREVYLLSPDQHSHSHIRKNVHRCSAQTAIYRRFVFNHWLPHLGLHVNKLFTLQHTLRHHPPILSSKREQEYTHLIYLSELNHKHRRVSSPNAYPCLYLKSHTFGVLLYYQHIFFYLYASSAFSFFIINEPFRLR